MKVVIPFHRGDSFLVCPLFQRMKETEVPEEAILAFPRMPLEYVGEILSVANSMFKNVSVIMLEEKVSGWPMGPNYAFLKAISYIHQSKLGPFLFLEPDAVPVKKGWFSSIKGEYFGQNKPFMGSLNKGKDGFVHFSGVGVYPENAYEYWKEHLPCSKAFDMINQDKIVPLVHPKKLIYNFWGCKDMPPTFKENREKSDPVNTMTLSQIPKETVLFHRCKDLSLTHLLKALGL